MEKKKPREQNDTTAAATIVYVRVLFCPNEGGDICNSQKKKEKTKNERKKREQRERERE